MTDDSDYCTTSLLGACFLLSPVACFLPWTDFLVQKNTSRERHGPSDVAVSPHHTQADVLPPLRKHRQGKTVGRQNRNVKQTPKKMAGEELTRFNQLQPLP